MKTCSKCKEKKELTEYHKNKTKKDGLRSACKKCESIINKNNYDNNIILKREYQREYRKKIGIIKIRQYKKNYEVKNKEKIKINRNKIYLKNKEKFNSIKKEYYQKNKYILNKKSVEYNCNRYRVDHFFCLKQKVRNIISKAVKNKNYKKATRTHEILGCSFDELKIHFERQFTKGMTWDNRSEWHIDHIIPISSAKTEEDVIRLNHYTNLRPLWAKENLSKSDKIITHQLVLL